MAVGQIDVQPIQAGASAQPLVTSASDVVTPDAIGQLTDSFRKGFITADDVINRVGAVGQAQKKALLEQLGEYVNPDVIKSRMSAATAATAQNTLAQQQAQAAQGLIQPAANLQSQQIGAATAAITQGPQGLDAYNAYKTEFGEKDADYLTKAGQPDYAARAERGNEMANKMGWVKSYADRLTPAVTKDVQDTAGNHYAVSYNSMGANVTPPHPETGYPGSDAYWSYVDQLLDVAPQNSHFRGTYSGVRPTISGNVIPSTLGVPVSGTVQPANAADTGNEIAPVPGAAVVAAPASSQFIVPHATTPGYLTAPAQTDVQAKEALHKIPNVDDWLKAQGIYSKFNNAAVQAKIGNNGQPTTANDLELAESYAKMVDPNSSLREFKWDAIKGAIPLKDRVKDVYALLSKNELLPPSFRDEIIKRGYGMIDGHQQSVQADYADTDKRNPQALNSEEKLIAQGVPFSQRFGGMAGTQPAGAAPPQPAAGTKRTVNVPGIGPVIVNY